MEQLGMGQNGVFQELAPCGFLRSSVFLSDALNYFLPIPSHVCERIARVENCPAQELLFSESIARNMARLFFDKQIAKTKLK